MGRAAAVLKAISVAASGRKESVKSQKWNAAGAAKLSLFHPFFSANDETTLTFDPPRVVVVGGGVLAISAHCCERFSNAVSHQRRIHPPGCLDGSKVVVMTTATRGRGHAPLLTKLRVSVIASILLIYFLNGIKSSRRGRF